MCLTAAGIPWKTRTGPNAATVQVPVHHAESTAMARSSGPAGRTVLSPSITNPLECPVEKNEFPQSPDGQPHGRGLLHCRRCKHATCDPRFPFVGTTYRVSEHWQTGLMTRPQPWLMELQPQMFVEMSEDLAALRGIKNGERVNVTSARASVECTAIVTKRFKPFKIGDSIVHQVGVPWHFGWRWPSTGKEESANLLTPPAGDPNTRIPETKAFMVNVVKL